ncbi:MAG: BadF/BadG/BcrA/BcrD ATPase family protein, partial [Fimbriimonadaceae bacterium]
MGLDGGGSTCRAAVIDDVGEIVFLGQGGAANFSSTPMRTLQRSIERALESAPKVDQICGCFAGLVHEEARQLAQKLVGERFPKCPIRLMPDYIAAHRASPEGTTVCVIAGTGSIVCSKIKNQYVKSGGGGPLLGDEGSGFAYGRHLIRDFLKTGEGTDKLLAEIRVKLGTVDPNEVLGRIYSSGAPAALVASFAASFFRDVSAGAEYARNALQ